MSRLPGVIDALTLRAAAGVPYPVIAAALAGVGLAALSCAAGNYVVGTATVGALIALGLALAGQLRAETLLVGWFALTPLASYYVRYPVEKSLLTFDRAVFAGVGCLLLLDALRRPGGWRLRASHFEIAWAVVAALALVSVALISNDVGYALKIAVDSFCLPLVAFHVARYHLSLEGHGKWLLVAAMALAYFLLLTGAYEFLTGNNLFPWKGSELFRASERRVNGPFSSDTAYAIISLLVAVFLRLAPRFLRVKLDAGGRLAYAGALAAVVAAALLPTFRAIALALIACWLVIEAAANRNLRRAVLSAAAAGVLALTLLVGYATLTGSASLAGRLTSATNVYGRLLTWGAALEITADHPLSGVGFMNYRDYFEAGRLEGYRTDLELALNVRIANTPHSNLFWIAAELGVIALALYVYANLALFLMGRRALRRAPSEPGRAAAATCLALFVAYWIPGLTLASGVYSDLNLYFFFLYGLLMNLATAHFPAALE